MYLSLTKGLNSYKIIHRKAEKMLTLNTTPKLYNPNEAEAIAAEMNDGDDDWTYEVDHDPKGTGYSRIIVKDEDGEFVAYV